jgi:hypothetical protein
MPHEPTIVDLLGPSYTGTTLTGGTSVDSLNCFINQRGDIRPIGKGYHAIDRAADDCIRVSTPEGRRAWSGIAIERNPSMAAGRALVGVVNALRDEHHQTIRIDWGGGSVEEYPADFPAGRLFARLRELA